MNVYLLTIVAVVSIIALVTIYINMNDGSSFLMPEEAIAGQAISTNLLEDSSGTTLTSSEADSLLGLLSGDGSGDVLSLADSGSGLLIIDWRSNPALSDPIILEFFFREDISNVKEYTP